MSAGEDTDGLPMELVEWLMGLEKGLLEQSMGLGRGYSVGHKCNLLMEGSCLQSNG